MYKVEVDIIHGNRWMDNFMHAADAFDKGRFLGNYENLIVEVADDCNVFTLAKDIADMYSSAGQLVSFVGLKTIAGNHITHGTHYFKEGLQTISTGRQWGMACDMITQLGYIVETNERRIITKINSGDG